MITGRILDHCHTDEDEEMLEEEENEHDQSEISNKDLSSETGIPDETGASDTSVNMTQETTPSGEILVEQSVPNVLRPDLSEVRTENNRDTMLYLKKKRINRHKSNDINDAKKVKSSN